MFDVWLFLSLKNILPLGKCVCLNVKVWLFLIQSSVGLLPEAEARFLPFDMLAYLCEFGPSIVSESLYSVATMSKIAQDKIQKLRFQLWNVWTELRHMQLLWLLDKERFPQPGFTHVVHLDRTPNEKAFPEFSLKPGATSFKIFRNKSA